MISIQKFNIGDKVKIIGNHKDPHKFEIGEIVTIIGYNIYGGDRYDCTNQKKSWMVNSECIEKIEDTIIQEPKVGDWVKCINHSNKWSEKFTLGEKYKVLNIDNTHYLLPDIEKDRSLWVPKQDFIFCNGEIQDDSEWKAGDKIQYLTESHNLRGFQDCTEGNIYTITYIDKDGYFYFTDDVGDNCKIRPCETAVFKKIINNQTTINYVKEFRSNSIELSGSHYAISNTTRISGCSISSSKSKIRISS